MITLTHEIPLRPREALLVDILLQAGDGLETTPDGLLPWMNVETVLNLLAARTGKRCSRGALTTMIYRIREKLEACGLSDGLLATDGKLGIRLAARLGQAREIREAIRIIGDLPKAQDPPTLLPLSETSALPV